MYSFVRLFHWSNLLVYNSPQKCTQMYRTCDVFVLLMKIAIIKSYFLTRN